MSILLPCLGAGWAYPDTAPGARTFLSAASLAPTRALAFPSHVAADRNVRAPFGDSAPIRPSGVGRLLAANTVFPLHPRTPKPPPARHWPLSSRGRARGDVSPCSPPALPVVANGQRVAWVPADRGAAVGGGFAPNEAREAVVCLSRTWLTGSAGVYADSRENSGGPVCASPVRPDCARMTQLLQSPCFQAFVLLVCFCSTETFRLSTRTLPNAFRELSEWFAGLRAPDKLVGGSEFALLCAHRLWHKKGVSQPAGACLN